MLTYELQRNVSRALEIFCLIVRDNNMPGAHRGMMTDKNHLKKLHHGLHSSLKFLVLS